MDDDTELTSPSVSPEDEQRAAEAPAIKEDGDRSAFDPTPYMRQLRGRGGSQDYLDVKWRLLWLRREHPDAQIITEHVKIDDDSAIFKATVSVPSGGRATGYGSETAGDFGDFIEKAETKAIGRALNALGYGAQFAEGDEEGGPAATARPIPATRPRRPAKAPDPAPIPMNTVSTPVAVPAGPPPASEAPPREMTRSARLKQKRKPKRAPRRRTMASRRPTGQNTRLPRASRLDHRQRKNRTGARTGTGRGA